MRPARILTFCLLPLVVGACLSTRRDPIDWGRRIAQSNCARCHAIRPEGGSPNAFAPPFRDLRNTQTPESIAATFARPGTVAPHPPMPSFAGNRSDIEDLLAYIKSVQSGPAAPLSGQDRPQH